MTRYIVVSGGVISGVGKGITTASIARLLKEAGYETTAIKIDPYINYDAGTLRPTEHGEVWVTDDGGEIDQDLGNYERFLGQDIPKKNNLTTGQVYKAVIDREREGKYLGKTVQFIPHIPDEIKNRVKESAKGKEFCLIEIGGTIGDFENIPFLFAMKSLEREVGKNNIVHIMVTYLPVPSHIDEMKTKPTQQAIRMLSESGIFPDFIVCRAKKKLDKERKKKIEVYANISEDKVISEPDIDTIYQVPIDLNAEKFTEKILKEFDLSVKKPINLTQWSVLVNNIRNAKTHVKVAVVCKYVKIGDYSLIDSYVSVKESLIHSGAQQNTKIDIDWIDAESLEQDPSSVNRLSDYDGILVPGGFGTTGFEGKILATKYARENNIPFLGLCLGMQLAVVEFARNICGMKDANTTEKDPKTPYPVIDILESQKKVIEENRYGGTMRLGGYAAILKEDSLVLGLYTSTDRFMHDQKSISALAGTSNAFRLGMLDKKDKAIIERHRHRYEVNPIYVDKIQKEGLTFSGQHIREDGTRLMEFIELKKHKYFVATQSHPEFKSRLEDPSPLFLGFVKAMLKKD